MSLNKNQENPANAEKPRKPDILKENIFLF
jgi:hypothetical protein